MQAKETPWAALAGLLAFLVLVGTFDLFPFLWVFPVDPSGVPLWMVICGLDIFLARTELPIQGRARLLLWSSGLLFFSARQGVPAVGLALVTTSAALWVGEKARMGYLPIFLGLVFVLLALGHDGALLHPGMAGRLGDFRFSCHLIASFALFRMLSWVVAVRKRGARPSFLLTMEYFLSPAFWLSPMHAAHLVFDHFEAPAKPIPPLRSLGWILRGFAHAAVFSFLLGFMPQVQARFTAGFSSFRWWELLLLGPLLFLASYLEKSRVSYAAAGVLSLCGHDVEPDFRSPWLARNLLEYWRRFHSWMWEYYVDLVYMPLSAWLARRLRARAASLLALLLTFTLGTAFVHWVHYPATLATALVLGFLFGAASLLHGILAEPLRRPAVGIPATWLTVFVLYMLAYPAYGLGWGLPEFLRFFGR